MRNDEKELADLTLAVVAINGWNRFAISFRCPCCFSEAHPNGLVEVGITALVHSTHHCAVEEALS